MLNEPWDIIEGGSLGFEIVDSRRATVADVCSKRAAFLVAAAPSMLDCLKRLRDHVRTNGKLVGWNSGDLDYIEAVIACAENGTPIKFKEMEAAP